jgi:hypothetical protein
MFSDTVRSPTKSTPAVSTLSSRIRPSSPIRSATWMAAPRTSIGYPLARSSGAASTTVAVCPRLVSQ